MSDLTYLTTKEVADLLRVKERKVYDLATANEIPHRRITGKLLFPRAEVLAWIDGNATGSPDARPDILTGSHDPLLDWAIRESGAGLATLLNGSFEGLDVFDQGAASAAGLHISEAGGWNVRTLSKRGLRDCVLVVWAVRSRGLILARQEMDLPQDISDLRGKRVVLRQKGSGAATLFDSLLAEVNLTTSDLDTSPPTARTEHEAAATIAAGDADAALGIEAMANQFHLDFVPLLTERFDLLIDRRAYFGPPMQKLLEFAKSDMFRAKAAAMGGYDISETGTIRWVSA
ncbi:MAG: substrate-binding domain-containing protein [Marinibacterium sp.]